VSKQTTIATLKALAMSRIYKSNGSTEAPLLQDIKVELFLLPCALRTTDAKDTTVEDLGHSGANNELLNIFIVPMRSAFADEDKPQDLWAFECSNRGIATFLTCLKVLIAECRRKDSANRRMLKSLFKITHFPPALEALHTLKEDNKLNPYQVAILATCFRELALRMVPATLIGSKISFALQGSRQIFAWLEDENCGEANHEDDPEAALVRSVKLEENQAAAPGQATYQPGKRKEVVRLEGSGDSSASSSSTDVRQLRAVTVTVHMTCRENLKLLALALWGYYDGIENFYTDFRGSIDDPISHRRTAIPGHRQFSQLLMAANASQNYQLKPPKALDEALYNCITLSADGYVSQFGTADGEFKDAKKHMWNAVSGTVILDAEPGDDIAKALESIKKRRLQEGTWDVDEWGALPEARAADGNDLASPEEAIVICFDLSYSMNDPLGENWTGAPNDITKLTETKQFFENVIGRMLGYQLVKSYISVVTFSRSTRIRVVRQLSRITRQQEFADMVKDLSGSGTTALWDAIETAKDILIEFKRLNPKTKLRVIALTDGEDNDSVSTTPAALCRDLYDAEIVLDSIVIGSSSTTNLFKLSKHTGGYAFEPSSRLLLFQTFLLEPFLDISARPDIVRVPVDNYEATVPKPADMQTIFDFPPCRKHQLEEGNFVSLAAGGRFFATRSCPLSRQQSRTPLLGSRRVSQRVRPSSMVSPFTLSPPRPVSFDNSPAEASDRLSTLSDRSTQSVGRVYLSEISQMLTASGDQPFSSMEVYISETDMSYWKVVMEGPDGTPYASGAFLLSVSMSSNFPQVPPTVRFLTPILHPNVTKVCKSQG
jgi:uncharacterized protein YegL